MASLFTLTPTLTLILTPCLLDHRSIDGYTPSVYSSVYRAVPCPSHFWRKLFCYMFVFVQVLRKDTYIFSEPFPIVGLMNVILYCHHEISSVLVVFIYTVWVWSVCVTDRHFKKFELWRPVKNKWSDVMDCCMIYCGG